MTAVLQRFIEPSRDPRKVAWLCDSHFGPGNSLPACGFLQWASGGVAQAVAGTAARPALVDVLAQNSGAYAGFGLYPSAVLFGAGTFVYQCGFAIPTVSNSTDRHTNYHGFHNSVNAAEPTNGVYLRQADDVNSGKFQLVANTNAVTTTADLGVTPTDGTYYTLQLLVERAARSAMARLWSAQKMLCEVEVASNVPTATGRETGCGTHFWKRAGVNWRRVWVDFTRAWMVPTTRL